MESCKVRVTPSAQRYGNLYVSSCKPGFFPTETYGESSAKKGLGTQVTLEVDGLSNPVLTDIAKDKKLFRGRGWVKTFVKQNNLKPMDEIEIIKISNAKYRIKPVSKQFTFIDLFAGIGGFRIPLKKLGGVCLGFSEVDKDAIEVYKKNFISSSDCPEKELGDITKLGKLPFEVDLITGGVPCQSWSVAGKKRGFDDPRGQLWMDAIRVVNLNQPKAFIFENVKGLMDSRNRQSLEFIVDSFKELGYKVKFDLLNSYDFGLPQNRDRIFIVGIRKDSKTNVSFSFPKPLGISHKLCEFIDGVPILKNMQKKKFSPEELFGNKIPMSRNRFQKVNQLNDFFIFCDTRNGHTTIHSWEVTKTSKREKEICMAILKNRRKKIYGPLDGNPLSYKTLKTIIPDLNKKELEKLVDKKILRIVKDEGYEFVNSKNSSGINGIYRIFLPHSNVFSTLTATGTKDMVALESIKEASPEVYKQEFITQIVHKKKFRPISAKEASRLQGFPDDFILPKDDRKAHKQFGNAVSTNVIYHLTKSLIQTGIFK